MGKNFKFELNNKGVIELFKSPAVQSWLQDCGDYVADLAEGMAQEEGAEYSARAHLADRTAIANVYPDSKEAAHDNYEHNTLLKAKGASGLKQAK